MSPSCRRAKFRSFVVSESTLVALPWFIALSQCCSTTYLLYLQTLHNVLITSWPS